MGLFSRKKERDEGEELPPLRFPEMGRERRLPRYESEISPAEASSIKEAVQPGLEIPIRKPKQYRPLWLNWYTSRRVLTSRFSHTECGR